MPLKVNIKGTEEDQAKIHRTLDFYLRPGTNRNLFEGLILGKDSKSEVEVDLGIHRDEECDEYHLDCALGGSWNDPGFLISLRPVKDALEYRPVPLKGMDVRYANKEAIIFTYNMGSEVHQDSRPFGIIMFYDPKSRITY